MQVTLLLQVTQTGSDNLEQIASFLITAGLADDTTGKDADKRYPAFYFAKNYKNTVTNLEAAYGNGWYLPTVAELFDIAPFIHIKLML